MTQGSDYKRAYERQKLAREKAELLLEVRSRELFEANDTLKSAYNTLRTQNDQLAQQEKLASIGLLAAGVAHEINNPVGFVKSNLQTLEDYTVTFMTLLEAHNALVKAIKLGDEKQLNAQLTSLAELARTNNPENLAKDGVDCIKESLAGIERIEEIIFNLSDFARSDSDDSRMPCDINNLLDSTLKLLWNEIKHKCDIKKDYGQLPQVWGRPGQLRQVFVNIIVNAIQAMGTDGTLQLTTKTDGESIHVSFIDSGPGLEGEALQKLFEPFYTTKDVGAGTGLGLYVSHGIVRSHGGNLLASNNSGHGACFTVTLPIEMRKGDSR